MRMHFYTLEKEDISPLEPYIPKHVLSNISAEGYYTLGAVCDPDGDRVLMGMLQFYVGMSETEDCYAELIHVFVLDEYRRRAAGVRLVNKADSILSGEDIDIFMVRVSPEDISDLSEEDLESFLKECGFISTKDDIVGTEDPGSRDPGQKRFFRFTGR
ncbi:MAG: hypothetical protein K6G42_03520 [Lachnospiraceae bacterium]|nr:hypothetical protein [Lachnospiraceae bacterium]